MKGVSVLVSIFGAPGSGKSTTAAGVYSWLKRHGVPAELLLEQARWDVLLKRPIDNIKYYDDVIDVLLNQRKGDPRVYVTDCHPLMFALYDQRLERPAAIAAQSLYGHYDTLNYLLFPDVDCWDGNDPGRLHDFDQAWCLHHRLADMITGQCLSYRGFQASDHRNLPKAIAKRARAHLVGQGWQAAT